MAEKDEYASEFDSSAWNLSQQIIFTISNLLQRASVLYSSGKIYDAYISFREIRILIHADLNAEERDECRRLERLCSKCKSYKPKDKVVFELKDGKKEVDALGSLDYFLLKYREYIIELLAKYGYHVSKKKDASKMF